MTEMKNAIIGTALGYGVEQVKNFVFSFREHNTKDDLIFMVNRESLNLLKDFFILYNVKPVMFETFKYIDSFVNNSRFIRAYELLSTTTEYKNILLCDIRDIIFQSDPFVDLPEEFLYFFEEDAGIPLGMEEFNSRWIKSPYGEEGWSQIKDFPIICSGIIMGSTRLIVDLLEIVINEMLRLKSERTEFFKTDMIDQGVVNYIARFNTTINNISIKKPNGDMASSLGISTTNPRFKDIVTFEAGYTKINGKIPAILHQYDRVPLLTEFYNKKYQHTRIN